MKKEHAIIMPLVTAGRYLKELRKQRKFSQAKLGDAVDVSRSTILRLEAGDATISIGIILRTIEKLNASPRHYYDLAVDVLTSWEDVQIRQAILDGIQAYIRVLCERKQIEVDVLADVMRTPASLVSRWRDDPTVQLSELALLMALVYLEVPLTDIADIVRATKNHETLGRQRAEERSVYVTQIQQTAYARSRSSWSVPALEAIVRRLTVLVRNSQELSPVFRHELLRIVDDLEHYHTRASVGVENIMARP
jgi:DNA-binding XRE family transcriptional regulator